MKKLIVVILVILLVVFILSKLHAEHSKQESQSLWNFTSIDTMKYSRDLSREKLNDPLFDRVIDQQMAGIAATGATHVSIATPYDDEFLPILKRWVASARAHNLHVWFRGNFSGWEGWFGYAPMTRTEHTRKTHDFILSHPEFFQDGDVFTACPECENGGPGDPRKTGDITGYQQFLIVEYQTTKNAFASIHKQVRSNFDSMNADVAKVVMDPSTTQALDGIVTIDHYIANPKEYPSDITQIAQLSGGKIVIGEFGAPVPDLHGDMTPDEQAAWIREALAQFASVPDVVGVNYWVNVGGTTQLWKNGHALPAVQVVRDAYTFKKAAGYVVDETNTPISTVKITSDTSLRYTDPQGEFILPYLSSPKSFTFSAPGYFPTTRTISNTSDLTHITLKKIHESLLFTLKKQILHLFTNL